ncbi:MAG: glycerol-3-phosphate 1-O-acyltransferase PlsY [Candidatus Binatus sp.]|uniref:glycerol-3-phosphate 1-O-acyltransferase PlsY n=1 Tax=Candidatus Binatus sp. TaxID=2811406 RepID=UPI002723F590|nr:glycerol-3-phosphate 1-O-acyltransferase PlsY [Candidatus Binatus sp.]MDO8434985.1 glycerol-3-phosphate 1-O-acyltransferase PlsY [Candidatus Binatus sp.]
MTAEIVLLVAAYLIGSIPTGVIVGRLYGFDPRAVGSGNIGMVNVARAGGSSAAAITFIGDVLKGAIPVIIARGAGFSNEVIAWTGLAAFAGSIYSIFLRFRGGKGVSAALGVWLAISWPVILFALAIFGVVFAATRIMSVASMAAAIALPPAVAAMGLPRHYLLLAILMTALVLLRHRENIARLSRGEEERFQPKRRDANAG